MPTLIALGALILLFALFAGIYSERLWYSSVDQAAVFDKRLLTQIGLFAAFGGFMALLLLGNMLIAYRSRPRFGLGTAEQMSLEGYRRSVEPIRWVVAIGVAGEGLSCWGGAPCAGS